MIDTSLQAWESIKEGLSKKQKQVLGAIIMNEEATNEEIATYLGVGINCVTGRTCELLEMGKIVRGNKVKTRSNRFAYKYKPVFKSIQLTLL